MTGDPPMVFPLTSRNGIVPHGVSAGREEEGKGLGSPGEATSIYVGG